MDREKKEDIKSPFAPTEQELRDREALEKMRFKMPVREIKKTPEFKRFIASLRGKYKSLGHTVDDFLREKREEAKREWE